MNEHIFIYNVEFYVVTRCNHICALKTEKRQ